MCAANANVHLHTHIIIGTHIYRERRILEIGSFPEKKKFIFFQCAQSPMKTFNSVSINYSW